MGDTNLISNTACPCCKKGKMKFQRLIVNRYDYGNGNKFLVYKCDSCEHYKLRPFMNMSGQVKFNI